MSSQKKPSTFSTVWTRYKSNPNFYNWICLTWHIFKCRFRDFVMEPNLYKYVMTYRYNEPKWLAKLTCPSYAFQSKIDDAVDNYLKKTKVKVYQRTYHDPGITTEVTYIVKKGGWIKNPGYRSTRFYDEQSEWKHNFERAVEEIWGLGEYHGAWSQDAVSFKGKWCHMNWQWHFVHNFKKDFFGHHHEFCDANDSYKPWRNDDY